MQTRTALMTIDKNDLQGLVGATVIGPDGDKIGDASQFYLSDTTGEPTWATVKTGLFGTQESFVPLSGSSARPGELRVAFDKATVKSAPRVDVDGHLTPEEEDDLYRYYGIADGDSTTGTADTAPGLSGDSDRDRDGDRGDDRDRDLAGRDDGDRDTEEPRKTDANRDTELDAVTPGETRTRMRRYVVTEQVTQTVEELPEDDDRSRR
jgi:hypothetical protein